MRYLLNICGSLIILTFCIPAWAQMPTYNVGRTPTPEEIRAADTAIGPEGKELPPGSGTAKQGAPIFAQKCAACHGPSGEGTNFSAPCGCSRLVGGKGTITTANPIVTVGSFWPFATTIWDFINRAMPFNKPGSLIAMASFRKQTSSTPRVCRKSRCQIAMDLFLPIRSGNRYGSQGHSGFTLERRLPWLHRSKALR